MKNWIIYVWFTFGFVVLGFSFLDISNGIHLRANSSNEILSILVTFLVAWQIWQTITTKEEIKEALKVKKEIEKVQSQITLNKEYMQGLFWHTEGNRLLADRDDVLALACFANATAHYVKGNADVNKEILQSIVSIDAAIGNLENYKDNDISAVQVRVSFMRKSLNDAWKAISMMDQNLSQVQASFEQVRARFDRLLTKINSKNSTTN